MRAPKEVLDVWKLFDDMPMETLTKAWYYTQPNQPKQRTVEQMKEHRKNFGTSGNCFDLALWLIHEFAEAGIEAYGVGPRGLNADSHVAVIAVSNGSKYFCDLGDLWVQPILIDPSSSDFSDELQDLFFPAAKVRVKRSDGKHLAFEYVRANGKKRTQAFELNQISVDMLQAAGEECQHLLRHPLVERRIFLENEVQHWEFDDFQSFVSTNSGLIKEEPLSDLEDWALRIQDRSGINKDIVRTALQVYKKMN